MTEEPVHFLVPGPLDQRTGGYLYDARMIAEMRRAGREVVVHELRGAFPDPDETARASMAEALEGLPDDAVVLVDGLAGGGLPEVLEAHARRLRLVGLVHHPLAEETGLPPETAERFARSERAALSCCRGAVVTSRFTASRLGSYGVARRRVRVAVPGTEPAEPAQGAAPGEPPRLLSVASLTPRKGHLVLLDALAEVGDFPWTCAFAGSEVLDPDHARAVHARVESLGLADRISFLGELDVEALDRAYRESTLFVLASYYEGYGMALTEAIARAIPVLSTTGGAIPYTVPAEAGVLVTPGDASALAQALRTLLGDDGATLSTLRAGAARAGADLPDWTRAARTFADAVDHVARGPAPPLRRGETGP